MVSVPRIQAYTHVKEVQPTRTSTTASLMVDRFYGCRFQACERLVAGSGCGGPAVA